MLSDIKYNPEKKNAKRNAQLQAIARGNFIKWTLLTMSIKSLFNYLFLVQESKATLLVPTAPIDSTKFVAYVNERRKKRILFKGEYIVSHLSAKNDYFFQMVLRSIDQQKCKTEIASKMGDKNNYPDTVPYDYNRVVISMRGEDEDSHYINASYVQVI